MMLSLLISIDDLKTLWKVETYNAHKHEFFMLKVVLLWIIKDFLTYDNSCSCTIKGYYVCLIYNVKTCSYRLKHGNKTHILVIEDFFDANNPYTKQKKTFNGEEEKLTSNTTYSRRNIEKG